MKHGRLITSLLLTVMCSLLWVGGALAGPAMPLGDQTQSPIGLHEAIPGIDKIDGLRRALSVDGEAVDFDLAQTSGADYVQGMQADITDDNAGNGTDGVDETPDDPDDGGWNWKLTSPPDPLSHTTAASSTNLYGVTVAGLYYSYLETGDAGYFTAMTDAADTMINNPNVRSAGDLVFLMMYQDFPGIAGTAYQDSARVKYHARLVDYGGGTAQGFAEYIRDVRMGQGYENGIAAWDIGAWVRVAAMLDARYPGNGYDTDADDMAEVVWQDSFNDTPGYFDVVDDAGWDPTYADYNFYWYYLGITGLIDAFDAAGVHTGEIAGLVTLLLEGQAAHGGISFCYGANAGDEDWQSTAYAMMTLARLDQATYQSQINEMGYFLAATQDASGGWLYASGNHYPEIGGECTAGLYFTTNTTVYDLAAVLVGADFTGQGDVDVYNDANGTDYVWGYNAFATIQEGMDAVDGSTITLAAGTYYETVNITTAGLNIIGVDRATVIIDPTGLGTNNAGIYVGADNVTLQSLTLQSTVTTSLPRYGIKFGEVDGCTLEDVTTRDVYRSGIDALGTSNLTITNVTSMDNVGHGLSLVDCNDVAVTDVTFSGNGWQNVSVATWGRYAPLGTSGIVFAGTNSFGDLFQLELGDYNNPGVPPAGAAVMTYSTNILDGADVTVQASDFGFALHGEQDDSPGQGRIWFFSTLTNAAIVPGLGGGGHWTGNDMYIESLTDGTQLHVTPGCSFQAAIGAADPGDIVNVAAGTYSETVAINKTVEVIGAGVTQTFVTGGMTFADASGVVVQHLHISGVAASNSMLRTSGNLTDFTMDNCILDGAGTGAHGYSGGSMVGDVTITNCEFMGFTGWSLWDSRSGSGGDGSAMGTITFANNDIHECDGSISFRGLSTDRTDVANVYSNTWTNIGDNFSAPSQHWAAFEINRTVAVNFYDNVITNVALGEWGEGQGLQVWDIDVLDVYDNDFVDCYQGIWVYGGGLYAVPGGSIYHNDFTGGSDYNVAVDASCIGGGTLDAEENYYGTIDYATISGLMSGPVDFDPWCLDDTHTNCTLTYPVTEVWVDGSWAGSSEGDPVGGHVFGYNAFATIQDGCDGVTGSTVNVAAGTYVEQLHITTNDLVLAGAGVDVTIIQSPATLTEFFSTGTNDNYPIVFVDGATNVSISGLTIDGNGLGNANYRFLGLAFWNSDGSFTDAKVVNIMNTPFSGAQHGVGVYSYNDTGGPYTIVMNDVVVDDFQKTAVALYGAGLTVDVDLVTTIGAGPTSVTAQNGLQVGPGVLGTVDNCTISAIAYTGGTWTATGFLNDGDVIATGLVIDACQTSVYWTDGSGTFTGGTITNPLGDAFYAYNSTTTKGASPKLLSAPFDPDLSQHTTKVVQNVTLSNTTITGTGAADSWGIGAFSTSADVVNLTVTGCTIDNFDYGIYAYDYGGPVNIVASGNAIVNCPHGMGASATLTQQNAIGNWWGSSDAATVAGLIDGPIDYSPWWGANYVGDPHSSAWSWFVNNTGTLQTAVDAASAGDFIYLSAGAYAEGPQILVDKDLSMVGETAKSLVTITPTANTGSSGDSRGWFLVPDGVVFNFSNVTLDGAGYLIYQAIRSKGGGMYSNIDFQNILYNESGPTYGGVAIAVFPSTPMNTAIDGCEFSNIGRVGALIWTTTAQFTNNTYTGKGDGDWLDYGIDMAGSNVDIIGNTFTGCTGVASVDGSTSAGVMATTLYVPGTTANCEGNTFTANSTGLMIGYDDADESIVTATNGNVFLNNEYGVSTTASSAISLVCYGNIFDNTNNAEDDAGGTWDDGVSVGNCWMDFGSNAGYPTYYLVGGTAGSMDNYPNTDCGIDMSPDDILYHCGGTFTFDVSVGDAIFDLEAARYYFEYPAELVFESATALDPNYTVMTNLTDNATGVDVLIVDFMVGTGSQDGPADLFTLEFSGSTSYCSGEDIAMTADSMYDGDNQLIECSLPSPITLVADCDDPVFTVNGPAEGGFYNTAPVLDLMATDNCDIDAVYYQIDGCTEPGWVAIAGPGFSGNAWSDGVWAVPGFAGLTEEEHCVRFKVIDDNDLGNSDSCTYDWCFSKDVSDPLPPSDLVAEPGQNKVELNWTASTSSDVIGYRIQRVAWGDYPLYAPPGPTYSVDENTDVNVFDGVGTSHVDTHLLSNTTRDVYYYAIFAYDAAGNFSIGNVGANARSTSYWLGDISDEMLTMGAYDGFVLTGDLYHLAASYWYSSGDPGFEPQADWGPTADANPKGIPTPDGTIGIFDLSIFAINYGAVNPTMKAVPLFANQKVAGPLDLTLSEDVVEGKVVHRLSLNNCDGQAKTLHVVMDCGNATLVSCETQVEAEVDGCPIFAKARQVADHVEYDFALIGNGTAIGGSGELATLVFAPTNGVQPEIKLIEAIVLDNNNEDVPVVLFNGAKNSAALPGTFALMQNYPNPFNPTTQIAYQVPNAGHITIEVFNLVGQRVRTLVDNYCEAGNHVAIWNGNDGSNRAVSSGVYFYRMTADDFVMSRKMMLVK